MHVCRGTQDLHSNHMNSLATEQLQRPADPRVVAIHQPHYFPWLGLIAKIACSDIFVFLDSVQFEKNGWQNRTRYSTVGGLRFLTLPIRQEGIISGSKTIREIALADAHATRRHWQTLRQRYHREPGWARIASRLEVILTRECDRLLPLALATTYLTLELFQLTPKIMLASDLSVPGTKSDRLVNLVRAVSGTHYLSGAGANQYINPPLFDRAGLQLTFQQFTHPVYRQLRGLEFMPGAFALEWFLVDPDGAAARFHKHLRSNASQALRCALR